LNTFKKKFWSVLVCSFIMAISLTAAVPPDRCAANEKKPPFYPGEKLVFELKWTFITAGEATLKVMPIMKVKGQDAYHFVMQARTNNFLDHIYKVRDRIDSYTDLNMNRAVFYAKKQHEGSYRKKVRVKFDWDKNQAQYTNLTEQKKKRPIDVMPGTFDPLSIFYYARTVPFEVGKSVRRPVTDGKKCAVGRAKIVKREKITVKAGTFETFLILPELKHIGGVFKKSPDAKIELWVTADERRLPVLLKSEVVVGSFSGELVSYTK
jgi:hypothetical protein